MSIIKIIENFYLLFRKFVHYNKYKIEKGTLNENLFYRALWTQIPGV